MTDIVTYCDVNTCEDCPRYGDDCDGDKRVEHTDLISRADAIEELQNCIGLIQQDGQDYLDERDIPLLDMAIEALSADSVDVNEVTIHYKPYPSADAVHIHNDGTLEVKVPNAQKVGRVLVMDTDSHIGGGLFYPDDAVCGAKMENKK